MTGSGTQDDPYIVENYDDFLNMKAGASSYYKLGTNIDFSQTDRLPNDSPIQISFAELDGNGYTISNFFRRETTGNQYNTMFASTQTGNIKFKNLKMTGIYLAGGSVKLVNTSARITYSYCKISIHIIDSNPSTTSQPLFCSGTISDCEILVEGNTKYSKKIISGNTEGSLIKLDIKAENSLSRNTEFIIFEGNVSFSGITGQLLNDSSQAGYIMVSGKTLCSYFAIHFDRFYGNLKFNSGFDGMCFYDKNLTTDIDSKVPSSTLFQGLTTEQCKDADYLQSIGFPCIRGDSM